MYKEEIEKWLNSAMIGAVVTLSGFLLVVLLKIPSMNNLCIFLNTMKTILGFSMMIFRVIEKLGLTKIFGETMGSYVLVCIMTLVGTVAFVVFYQWILKKLQKFVG